MIGFRDEEDFAPLPDVVYVIERVDFDNMNPDKHAALQRVIVGFAYGTTEAEEAIGNLLMDVRTYQGHDGDTYPYFTATDAERLA